MHHTPPVFTGAVAAELNTALYTTINLVYWFLMKTDLNIPRALAALGHEARLGIFRLLVKAGHDGLTVGEIGQRQGLAASTLAHHLRSLVEGGLILQEKQGREVTNRVDFEATQRMLSSLTDECCAGLPPLPR